MVPTKVLEELNRLYDMDERVVDLHRYTGPLFDVVFDIITADSFVAGVASKILDRDVITSEERVVLRNPLLLEDRWWRCNDGQSFDLQPYPEVRKAATNIETLRAKCHEVLSLANTL